MPLTIKSRPAALDFLALGAVVHRLDPGVVPFRHARSLEVHVSGGEYNVAANLESCFGLEAGICTAMVDNGIGELVEGRIREMGVTPFFKRFQHDGVRGPNIATVYSDRGHGVRAPVVFYNRANEAGALLKPGDFDWAKIFSRGVRWFHSGGIFASLSETTSEVIIEGMAAAKAAGAVRSFDLNYRAKLWNTIPGGAAKGRDVFRTIAANVDVLIGNEEDMQLGLGIAGPKVDAAKAAGGKSSVAGDQSSLDASAFFDMIDRVRKEFPNIQAVATTLREVHSTSRHDWAAVLWLDGQKYTTPTLHLDVIDRIGGGDGFASGLIYGLIAGRPPEEALRLGWAHGALLTTFPGDVSMARLLEVETLAKGGTARVQR